MQIVRRTEKKWYEIRVYHAKDRIDMLKMTEPIAGLKPHTRAAHWGTGSYTSEDTITATKKYFVLLVVCAGG